MQHSHTPTIGTAAWSIPKATANKFPTEGSALQKYSAVFDGVEINSTFYKRHKPETFERWRDSVPDTFRFAVKLPKVITHELRLKNIDQQLATFLDDIAHLQPKLGPLLCQLPPNLAFDPTTVGDGLRLMRQRHEGRIVIEPRHMTWRSNDALALLQALSIDRVFADPPVIWQRTDFTDSPRYIRLHGKPKIYYTPYSEIELKEFSKMLSDDSWCILDNTASGAATANALELRRICGA